MKDFSNLDAIQTALQNSYLRSKQYGITHNMACAPESTKLSDEEFKKHIAKQKLFYDTATKQIDKLYTILKDKPFSIALADKEGYLLYVVADDLLKKHYLLRNYTPSYRWTEQDMGTCAIGITLIEQTPFYIKGEELYANGAKDVNNATSPIFDQHNQLLGVICISGFAENMHIHTLGMACQAAESIRVHLIEQYNSIALTVKNKYMAALLEAGNRGIITVDSKNCIVQFNKKACTMFELDNTCIGKPLTKFIKMSHNLKETIKTQQTLSFREMKTPKLTCFISLDPVINDNEVVGAIISFTEKDEIIKAAVEITAVEANFTFKSIIGTSKSINTAKHIAKIAAKNDAPVLILGETGSGKELFAQAIHNSSSRYNKPFLAINCGAIPKELLESELFGYEEGAFTGALKGGRVGKLELASSGTLFLDEIGDMPFEMQVKLLRVLQSGEVQRIGGSKTTKIDIRIISATNKDIYKEIKSNHFRSDLFYRISTLLLKIPPLRERKTDIPLLIEYFMKRHGYSSIDEFISPQAKNQLLNYDWPGNVRQLENSIERAFYLSHGKKLKLSHFALLNEKDNTPPQENITIQPLETVEKNAIEQALQYCGHNFTQCALLLRISRTTLYRKLEKYHIHIPNEK